MQWRPHAAASGNGSHRARAQPRRTWRTRYPPCGNETGVEHSQRGCSVAPARWGGQVNRSARQAQRRYGPSGDSPPGPLFPPNPPRGSQRRYSLRAGLSIIPARRSARSREWRDRFKARRGVERASFRRASLTRAPIPRQQRLSVPDHRSMRCCRGARGCRAGVPRDACARCAVGLVVASSWGCAVVPFSLLSLVRSARAAGSCWVVVPSAGLCSSSWVGPLSAAGGARLGRRGVERRAVALRASSSGVSAFFGVAQSPGFWFCFGRGVAARSAARAWAAAVGGFVVARCGCWWVLAVPVAAGLCGCGRLLGSCLCVCPRCRCGRVLGSGFCRCGRAFSAVAARAVGSGAGCVVVRSSLRAPCRLVALCAFPVWSWASAFARRCPALFGVVPPVVRRSGPGWVVSVPVSSRG